MDTRRWTAGCALLACGLAACAGGGDATTSSAGDDAAYAEWSLATDSALRIGVVAGDENYQMYRVTDAVQLPDGRIAVLNAGSSQLRIYDGAGRYVSSSGRKGEGPGEFTRPTKLYLLGDTLAVYDASLRRMTLHSLDGTYLSERSFRLPPEEWLFDGNWMLGPALANGRGTVLPALEKLPQRDTLQGYRFIRVAAFGPLWIKGAAGADTTVQHWDVHDLTGARIASVTMPATLRVFEVGADYLVGVNTDSLGVEYVQRVALDTKGRRLQRVAFTPDAPRPAQRDSADLALRSPLQSLLRNLATNQEIHYSNPASSYTYTTDLAQFRGLEIPEGIDLRILYAGQDGWMARAIDVKSGSECAMAFGPRLPLGWGMGSTVCSPVTAGNPAGTP